MFGLSKVDKFKKRIQELEESSERLERGWKNMQLEWGETYDKMKQLNWRVSKRVKTLEAQSPDEDEDLPPGDATPLLPSGPPLTQRQQLIQAQVLARRQRNGG